MATAYQKRAGLLAIVLVVAFVGLQGYFFWWESTVEEESDREAVAGHEAVEVSSYHRGSSVLLAGQIEDLRAPNGPSALKGKPLASTEPVMYSSAVDLPRSPIQQPPTKTKTVQSHQSNVACGLNRPNLERGFVSTLRISESIVAKYCAVGSNPASFAPLAHPTPESDFEDAAVNLFVGVTSPCGNVEFRDKRRREFLSAAAGFPADARYLFFVGMCGGDGTAAEDVTNADLDAELVAHGDIVQLSFLDTFHNLTLKSIAVFTLGQQAHYAAASTKVSARPPSYILKVEDYMRNSWNDVAAVVQERVSASNGNNAAPDLYYGGGAIFGGGKIFRRGRWGCSETHCPEEIFPTRYAGGMYMLSAAAARKLEGILDSDERLHVQDPYPIEDHFIANTLSVSFGIDVSREKRLWWKGGQPYNAPAVKKGDYLLQMHWEALDGSQTR